MVWRSSSTLKDRIFASLTFLVPILEVSLFGGFLFNTVPILGQLFVPILNRLLPIYLYTVRIFLIGDVPIVELAIFIALFVGVVRNEKLAHLLRFYTMQALLLAIVVSIFRVLLELLGYPLQVFITSGFNVPLIISTLCNLIFIGIVAASVYSIVQALRGIYAEIPIVSEAAYSQVR